MHCTVQYHTLEFQDTVLCYRAAGTSHAPPVLFLHGAAFSSRTWEELGTLELIARQGWYAVALDLPGFGNSGPSVFGPERLLLEVIASLKLVRPVLVSPSMSGRYSLPLVADHPSRAGGLVAIAPVGIPDFLHRLETNRTPVLALWGERDRTVPIAHAQQLCQAMKNSELVVLDGAGHACYMNVVERFHQQLLRFVQQCHEAG